MERVTIDGVECYRYLERLDRESALIIVTLVPAGEPNEYFVSRHVVGRGIHRGADNEIIPPTKKEHDAEMARARAAFTTEKGDAETLTLRAAQAKSAAGEPTIKGE